MTQLRYWRRWKVVARVGSVLEIPDRIGRRRAVVVGSPVRDKWLAFDCPCPSGHRVMVNLDPDNQPQWQVRSLVPLTVTPSVDEHSRVGRCHYVVREGRVTWVERMES